ncbi:NAD(P)-binding domain-containing protein [Emcibacter sp. SYSU 3D8]|uniref:NAD(P)/FAD-dependent oxidoreductase n=1 Tax=Emcibacter sp. SYSU 3D8 TaxID=3133969 RepID=UPI0031FE4D01
MSMPADLLIIGAGPFGLSLAAHARMLGLETVVFGQPMGFWKEHMPRGMILRSACDWHLDADNRLTIEAFLQARGQTPDDVEPLSRDLYLDYAEWFRHQAGIEPLFGTVRSLERRTDGFAAVLDDGAELTARNVAVAVGFSNFPQVPPELADMIPAGRRSHTCDMVDFAALKGKRCLIVGGRQSAFEWAALLADEGAAQVHVSHRHDSPAFAPSDWSWVNPLVDAMADDPGWFRSLSGTEQDALARRLWIEGRSKVEPWLEPRVMRPNVALWPRTALASCRETGDGLAVTLDDGRTLLVDHVILATGYKVEIGRVPFLAGLLGDLAVRDGFPVLDDHFQTSIPGLFITSMPATRDFGPFFAFTISVRTSACLIGQALAAEK